MFASRITKVVALPSDPSVSVTIRKLSFLQQRGAQQISQQESARNLIAMGGAAFMDEWAKFSKPDPAAAPVVEAPRDPLLTHDLLTVLVSGVAAWSVAASVNKETLADLGQDDAEFLAREILALSAPRTEAERGNGSAPSTAA